MKTNKINIALVAHVDSGKTTLSEALLYESGQIRKLGRVDNQDAFLDTNEMERERGITIFAKQARLQLEDWEVTLLDTPGHVDFASEMERTLQVLDYAVLVINGASGVQAHTRTLWSLLEKYKVPVFLFINKMDQQGTDADRLMRELREELNLSCVNFSVPKDEAWMEEIAMCGNEKMLEDFLETGTVKEDKIRQLIAKRRLFPCFFGSALKLTGVKEFMAGLAEFMRSQEYSEELGARVFKITRDSQGNRLTHVKVTGGVLRVKDSIGNSDGEKINQIRIYSGEKYEAVNEAAAGTVCVLVGITGIMPGEGIGMEKGVNLPILEPVLKYQLILPENMDPMQMLPKLRQLEEEEPELHIVWSEEHHEIQVHLMGDVQTEILARQIQERFGVVVQFGQGKIVYKETIRNVVEGVGHFEPLRHYAEVHLLLEPLERGMGMEFATDCSEDLLDKNWQRLIYTHLLEREHRGVLTGSVITDMRITLKSGRAHNKHTEGGDFRQATYRAVRQGLMQAESVLLEPYYSYRIEIPEAMLGRAMTDMEKMHGNMNPPEIVSGKAILKGRAPVAMLQDYPRELNAYSRGEGRLSMEFYGYEECTTAEEVIETLGYEPERDLFNTPDSVFCAHGAGFVVSWEQVPEYMHLESCLTPAQREEVQYTTRVESHFKEEEWLGTEEIDAILEQTFRANSKDKSRQKNGVVKRHRNYDAATEYRGISTGRKKKDLEEYLLVDGYNVIFAWDDLSDLAKSNIDSARGKLLDILCDYQGSTGVNLIVVFDAYRIEGHATEILDYHNIHVVFTKEAETADQYIEKFAHENGKKYAITVATSDGLEQIIIRGAGCGLLSARDLLVEIERMKQNRQENYFSNQKQDKIYLLDGISKDIIKTVAEEDEEKSGR